MIGTYVGNQVMDAADSSIVSFLVTRYNEEGIEDKVYTGFTTIQVQIHYKEEDL